MGLTSALYTGLSGLNSNQFRIDVIGDNIANLNTIGFKGGRSNFQTQFSQTLSAGSGPGNFEGGTNPLQIGLGSVLGAIKRQFTQGSIETTGVLTDLAVEGDGFFIVNKSDNERAFTRDGTFTVNGNNQLVTADGFFVQGYGVDAAFNLVPGVLTDLTIPLGAISQARATQNGDFIGNLDASGAVGTQGSIVNSAQFVSDGVGTPANAATAMNNLRLAGDPATVLFANGDTITVTGVSKGPLGGGRELADATFTVGDPGMVTMGDFAAWLEDALGINNAAGVPGTPGVTVQADGSLQIRGNYGEANNIVIEPGDISINGGAIASPFAFTSAQDANGESVTTSFVAYDSLGTRVSITVTAVLESLGANSVWRFYAESPDDVSDDLVVGTGTIVFDQEGQYQSATDPFITVDRNGTGAITPLSVTLDFSGLSSLGTGSSSLLLSGQDGFPAGTLNSFSIGTDGIITGTFTNGLARTLGQVALATFANPEGLISETNNTYSIGPNSGEAIIVEPLAFGAGRILSGALELSNVDLSREFIGLITASTGFSAAGRVITTSNELLDELLLIAR